MPVTLSYGNNRLSTYALLDSGSSVTLLAESAAKQLKPNLQGNQPLSVSGINTVAEIQVATLQCFIGPYNSVVQPHRLDNVLSVPTLNVQTAQPNFLNSVCQQHPHLKHVTFPQLHSNNVSLLIGVGAYDVICSRGVIHGPPNTPKALNTVLGWTIVGTSSHQLPTTAETLPSKRRHWMTNFFIKFKIGCDLTMKEFLQPKKRFQPTIVAPRTFSSLQQRKLETDTKSAFSGNQMLICPTFDGLLNASCAPSNNACRKTQHSNSNTRKQSMTILPRVTS